MLKSILISFLLLLASLSLYAQEGIPSWQDKVLGTWVWKRTECCNMGGGSHKKANPNGREKVIMMQKDSFFCIYKNGELDYKGKYKVHGSKFMKDPIMYMFFSEPMFGILRFKDDTLVIGNCATDGCDEYFALEKTPKKKLLKRKK